MLTFKFDESYRDQYVFVVGGFLADAEGWRRIHDAIRESLDFENGQLPPEMRVKRYHAAEMNCLDNDFESWNNAAGRVRERRMTEKLFQTLGENAKAGISVGLDLSAYAQLFPHQPSNEPYVLCMQLVMDQIGNWIETERLSERVTLVHDQGYDDSAARQAFEVLANDTSWKYHGLFESMTPQSSLGDLGLQAADRIAYETFKEISHQIFKDPSRTRPTLEALRNRVWHLYAFQLDRSVLEEVLKIESEKN